MSDFSDIYIESLSRNIKGEEHTNKDCEVIKLPAFINDHLGKNFWVFVRHCVCGKKRDAYADINNVPISVPRDGFDIHTSSQCAFYINVRNDGTRNVYRIDRRCHCRNENISYPGQ